MHNKITTALIVITIIAVSSSLYSWYKPPKLITQTQYIEVPKEKVVERIKTVFVTGPEKIITIDKEKIVTKLGLPAWVKDDDNQQIIANADLPCDESISGHSVVTVLNTESGEGKIIAKSKPLPFMSLINEREVGIRYGMSSIYAHTVDIYGSWQFLRVGNVHLGAYAEATSQAEAKGMLQAAYRF